MSSRKEISEDDMPDHMFRWLEVVGRRLRAELPVEGLGTFPSLRGAEWRLLQMVPADGIRITDLAVRASMTKQATGEFVGRLEAGGFAESVKDPRDQRVRLVRLTSMGGRASESVTHAIITTEKRWRRQVGARRYDEMKQVLRELARGAS
ncbi:MAG: winged helix DNA-binding protein [Propionibacteriales bacterium]|nr:winged helix DNA-binding protein [Propionibacteriales bacterium]